MANYPEHQIKVLEVPIISDEEVEAYIKDRIVLHLKARQQELPQCTKEEKWQSDSKSALMKNGAKRAIKLFDTYEAALAFKDKDDQYIEERKGEAKRCLSYCPVKDFCDQFKKENEGE